MKSATSDRQNLVSCGKQTNNLGHRGRRSVAEMTIHCITHHGAQFFTTLRLRHNRVTNRRGNEPSAQRVLLNIEDNLVHESTIIQSIRSGEPDSALRPLSPDSCQLTTANGLRLFVFWSVGRRGDPSRRLGCLLVPLHALRKEAA